VGTRTSQGSRTRTALYNEVGDWQAEMDAKRQTDSTETREERERLLSQLSPDDGRLVERVLAHHPGLTAANVNRNTCARSAVCNGSVLAVRLGQARADYPNIHTASASITKRIRSTS